MLLVYSEGREHILDAGGPILRVHRAPLSIHDLTSIPVEYLTLQQIRPTLVLRCVVDFECAAVYLMIFEVAEGASGDIRVGVLTEPDTPMLLFNCVYLHFEFSEGARELESVPDLLVCHIIGYVSEVDARL